MELGASDGYGSVNGEYPAVKRWNDMAAKPEPQNFPLSRITTIQLQDPQLQFQDRHHRDE